MAGGFGVGAVGTSCVVWTWILVYWTWAHGLSYIDVD
jgi:hypothetical protein